MKLGNFLQILHKYVGGRIDNKDYLAYIVDLIMREPETEEERNADKEEKYYPFNSSEKERDYAGRIYNATKALSRRKARIIISKYNPDAFLETIKSCPMEHLTHDLRKVGIACEECKAPETCEKTIRLFLDFAVDGIEDIDPAIIGGNPEPNVPVYDDGELKRKFGVTLLNEVNQHCPNDGCMKPLYQKGPSGSAFDYTIVQINPKYSADTEDNLIAMCPECARKYQFQAGKEKIARLEDLKLRFSLITETRDKLAYEQIVTGVAQLIHKIGELPLHKIENLNYNPTKIENKMDKEDPALFVKIYNHVSAFYPDVEMLFKNEESENGLDFEKFCSQIKYLYRDAKNQGHTQTEIFQLLVDWLVGETNEASTLCEVLVAYFVQKCEVFDDFSK